MQSWREGLTPFPYAESIFLINESKDKNKYFSTCTHLASYIASVYAGCSTTTHVHQNLCQKIKNKCWVSMSQQNNSDPWPSIYWKRSDLSIQLHFEGYKEANSEPWKRRENSTLRAKLLWRNYYFIIEPAFLCPLSLNTVFISQDLPLLMDNLFVSLIWDCLLWRIKVVEA